MLRPFNIRVSRVRSPTYKIEDIPENLRWSEAALLSDYFKRAADRMTLPATVPRRALFMGDFHNGPFWKPEMTEMAVFPSSYPVTLLKYPASSPHVWMRELRKGYEYVSCLEHSCPTHTNFGQDHGLNKTGRFCGYGYNPQYITATDPNGQLLTMDGNYPAPWGGGISKSLFFAHAGCNIMNWRHNCCLGQMLGMMQSGLISMGAVTENTPGSHRLFATSLLNGASFGTAFLQHVNACNFTDTTSDFGVFLFSLFGVGTLKMQPYVANSLPVTVLDTNYRSYYFNSKSYGSAVPGDSLYFYWWDPANYRAHTLRVYGNWWNSVDSSEGIFAQTMIEDQQSGLNPTSFKPHGIYGDTLFTDPEMQFTIHVEPPDAQPASAVVRIPFPWHQDYLGDYPGTKNRYFFRLSNPGPGYIHPWISTLLGRHGVWDMQKDKFTMQQMTIVNDDFEASASVDDVFNRRWTNYDTIVTAGMMLRTVHPRCAMSGNEASAYIGGYVYEGYSHLDYGNFVFMYRERDGGPLVVRTSGQFFDSWVFHTDTRFVLRRSGSKVIGEVRFYNGGTYNTVYADSATIRTNGRLSTGPAYMNTKISDGSKEYGAQFSNLAVSQTPAPARVTPYRLSLAAVVQDSGAILAAYVCDNPGDRGYVFDAGTVSGSDDRCTEFFPGKNLCRMRFASSMSWTLDGSTVSAAIGDTCSFRLVVSAYQSIPFTVWGPGHMDNNYYGWFSSQSFRLSISVASGRFAGQPAEFWITARMKGEASPSFCYTPAAGWYSVTLSTPAAPAYGGPLMNISPPAEIYYGPLARGEYIFSFAQDAVPDGFCEPYFTNNAYVRIY